MGLLNSNDYNRGYQNGYSDAMAGKEKSYTASGFSLKFALHGSKAIESYNEKGTMRVTAWVCVTDVDLANNPKPAK